ncbi:MAG: ATP-binding protein [Chloroflexi bacterium]|nr:ATP-binding protein [Chloroflexota bacterium]MBI4315827.1 ATP-binding protein [Chloroflexota bacterium]MBI5293558.1 ATP-binding protein [Chloroflexota bacterium]MBI5829049.1 ATP-binding protein [Chloroflexota bacterium]
MSESRLIVPARYERIRQICAFVVEAAEVAGLDETAIFHCQIAVDEACTNIIEHGYGGEDKGRIEVACAAGSGQLTIDIRDQAQPFDLGAVPEPELNKALEETTVGGLGIYFMRKMMDEVSFSRTDGANRLVLVKRRTQE